MQLFTCIFFSWSYQCESEEIPPNTCSEVSMVKQAYRWSWWTAHMLKKFCKWSVNQRHYSSNLVWARPCEVIPISPITKSAHTRCEKSSWMQITQQSEAKWKWRLNVFQKNHYVWIAVIWCFFFFIPRFKRIYYNFELYLVYQSKEEWIQCCNEKT